MATKTMPSFLKKELRICELRGVPNLKSSSMDPKHDRSEKVVSDIGKSGRVDVEEKTILGAFDAAIASPVHLIVFITILSDENRIIHTLCVKVQTARTPEDTVG